MPLIKGMSDANLLYHLRQYLSCGETAHLVGCMKCLCQVQLMSTLDRPQHPDGRFLLNLLNPNRPGLLNRNSDIPASTLREPGVAEPLPGTYVPLSRCCRRQLALAALQRAYGRYADEHEFGRNWEIDSDDNLQEREDPFDYTPRMTIEQFARARGDLWHGSSSSSGVGLPESPPDRMTSLANADRAEREDGGEVASGPSVSSWEQWAEDLECRDDPTWWDEVAYDFD